MAAKHTITIMRQSCFSIKGEMCMIQGDLRGTTNNNLMCNQSIVFSVNLRDVVISTDGRYNNIEVVHLVVMPINHV